MQDQVLAQQTTQALSLSLVVHDGSLVLVVDRGTPGISERVLIESHTSIGTARLVLSKSGRYLVASTSSGQSEESYDILELTTPPQHRGGLSRLFGEGASFAFSEDESLLAMVYPLSCTGFSESDIEAAGPSEGPLLASFGGIVIHDIASGDQLRATIVARVAPGFVPDDDMEFDADAFETKVSRDQLRFRTPWGAQAVVPFPVADTIVIQGPE
jgi:hypothetical protein